MSRPARPSPGADWSDREERLVASVLRIVAITFTSSAVMWVATSLLTGVRPLYVALGLPIIAGGLISLQLIRRGGLRTASWIVVLVPWLVLLASAALQGSVSTPVLGGSIVLIIAVGLLLGARPALLFALISGLSFTIAETQMSVTGSTLPELVRLGLSLIYLAGCALLSGFAASRIREAFSNAQNREIALAESYQLLAQGHERLRSLVESTSDLVTEQSVDGTFLYASEAFRDVLGWEPEEIVGQSPLEFVHPDDHDDVMRGLQALVTYDTTQEVTSRFRHRDGSWIWFQSTGNAIRSPDDRRIVIISRNITERMRLQEELRETQKRESLGLLAGGIAHDFNNLLVGIRGNVEMALEVLEPDSPAAEMLLDVELAGARASELVDELNAYVGHGESSPTDVNIAALIPELAHLLRSSFSKNVHLDYPATHEQVWIHGDLGQIRQVIVNLTTNAAEGMGDRAGVVTIRTGVQWVDREELATCRHAEDLNGGEYAFIEVRDNGRGMGASTLRKIFDPAFSTKSGNRGLGLAAVLGIVRKHGGTIRVESEPDAGSTFRVYLPSTAPPVRDTVPEPVASGPATRLSGTVLVIDDEEMVRTVVRRMLEDTDVKVQTVSGGPEGIAAFRSASDKIQLVILDITMPEMDGEEVFYELRAIRESVPVIFISGHTEDDVVRLLADKRRVGMVPKPFKASNLNRAIAALLNQSSES